VTHLHPFEIRRKLKSRCRGIFYALFFWGFESAGREQKYG